jgi:hypothetical protein
MAYYDKRDFERASRDMNLAIKLNPNFATAFRDRGIAYYDRHDFDRTAASADTLLAAVPTFAMLSAGHGSSYENRREGDRIVQEPNEPVRSNKFNAVAYSPETFPAASPPLLPSTSVRASAPSAAHAEVPMPAPAPSNSAPPAPQPTPRVAKRAVPLPRTSPKASHRPLHEPPSRLRIPRRAALSHADARPQRAPHRLPVRPRRGLDWSR